MRRLVHTGLILGALAIGGCASAPARTPGNYVSQNAAVFQITEAQADRILVEAMNVEFGNSPIVRVEHPNRGYQATISFLLDSHQIVATMVPSKGRSGDGAIRDGYAFDVRHTGTMPLSGMARAGRLRERLSRAAEALSPGVPAVR
ncbi:MAG: hypothetical protein J0M19_05845 [Sphingomonadales bacterium]|nr:hypothetical protein [Sphingomonadales bacterium]